MCIRDSFAGIDNIRSETDRTGIRAVIELKKGVNEKVMLDCLYKYSDLQITYCLLYTSSEMMIPINCDNTIEASIIPMLAAIGLLLDVYKRQDIQKRLKKIIREVVPVHNISEMTKAFEEDIHLPFKTVMKWEV